MTKFGDMGNMGKHGKHNMVSPSNGADKNSNFLNHAR